MNRTRAVSGSSGDQKQSFSTSDVETDRSPHPSASVSSGPLPAILGAIQEIFSTPGGEAARKTTKRTVLDRSRGQIVTEKIVIEQLEERQAKQGSKRPRAVSNASAGAKRRKQQ